MICVWMRGAPAKIQAVKVVKVDEIKYLRSTIQSNRGCKREVKKRVHAGGVSGVICDRRIAAGAKGNVSNVAQRPAMVYDL